MISTILLLSIAVVAGAQDVIKLLQPVYADSASTYRQSVYIPQKWEKCRILLSIERPLGATSVRVNGLEAGGDSAIAVPHAIDVTRFITAGQRNSIDIAVAGHDSRGILGTVELRSQPRRLYINKVRVHPTPYIRLLGLDVDVRGQSPNFGFYDIQVMVQHEDKDSANIYVANEDIWDSHMELELMIPDEDRFWDEFHPNRFRLAVSAADDYMETVFEAGVKDGQLFLNRRPVYLRGALMDADFAEWNHRMPTDIGTWERMFRRLKSMGINYVKFDGYCPVDAAFSAADKVGIYLHPAAASKEELRRITDFYGRHPSLVLVSLGYADYVWNDGYATHVELNAPIISGSNLLQFKQGIEQLLLDGDSGWHFLLRGVLDKSLAEEEFSQFCRPIIPLVRLEKPQYSLSDTLRVPVLVYNAMYGHLCSVRTSYFMHTDSGKVVAGGLVHSGDIPLAPLTRVGEIVFPLDTLKSSCRLTLTVAVGSTAVKNSWEIEVRD